MLLSEFIKDFGVKKYFRTTKNISYSLLASYIQLVLEGDWIGKLVIQQDFSLNSNINKYFTILNTETDTLRFGDVYIILSSDRYRYGVYLDNKAVIEQPNHLNPQHELLTDDIIKHTTWAISKGFKVVWMRPLNQKNIFPSNVLAFTKQDKPFATVILDTISHKYIVYVPGNHATYDNSIWAEDPTDVELETLAKQEIYQPLYLHLLDKDNISTAHYTGEYDDEHFTTFEIPVDDIDTDFLMLALIKSESTNFTINDIKWIDNIAVPLIPATSTNDGYVTSEQISKLDGIEALADVTDSTNVDAAGATMNTDLSLVGNRYFLDEDTMISNDATKVASQQSTKAYADTKIAKGALLINVKDYGAIGDGITDDTAAIQAADAIAATGKRTVYFPNGTYMLSSSISKSAGVSYSGESMLGTILLWHPTSNTAGSIIDTSNKSINGTTIENISFAKHVSNSNHVTGILGGSTLVNYNSAIGCFENLLFKNIEYGIRGNAESSGVGIFDSYFKNIWCTGCSAGLWLLGSGNIIDHPRITLCDQGIVFDYLNAESMDGATITGGIFIQNNYDYGILNANGVRPITFINTWFEQSVYGIINIPYANTKVMSHNLYGCMLSTVSTGDMFNVYNALGTITVDSATNYSGGSGKAQNFVYPHVTGGRLITRNIQKYDSAGVASSMGIDTIMFHAYASANTTLSPGWNKVNFASEEYDYNNNFASSRYTVTVAGTYKFDATILLTGSSDGESHTIGLYKNGSVLKRGSYISTGAASDISLILDIPPIVASVTDYFEIYVYNGTGSNRTVANGSAVSYFGGYLKSMIA